MFNKSKVKIELKNLLKAGKQKETNKRKCVLKNFASKKRKTLSKNEFVY